MASPNQGPTRLLQSWKEIASYLGVTVRSVQRWERDSRLPVHRQGAGKSARIYAYAAEIDAWLASGALAKAGGREPEPAPAAPPRARLLPFALAGGLLLAVAGVAGVWTGILPPFRIPHRWSADGQKLTIVDARNRVCWEKRFPDFLTAFAPDFQDKVRIEDIDGDRAVEVLFNYNPRDQRRPDGSLLCFDRRGALRWEFKYGARKSFGNRDFEPSFRGQSITPVRARGRPLLVTVANHERWYPSQVALIDPATGRAIEEYWHPGAIYITALHDLDGDGQQEFLFAAINNPGEGLGHAALGVLALPFSAAPRREFAPDDPFRPVTGGGELAYLLFPLPDVSHAAASLPIPAGFRVEAGDRILFQTPLPENGGITYYLNRRLELVEHRVSDNFVPLHRRMEREGLLRHPLTPAESASLAVLARFAAAPDGNTAALARFWPPRR